MKFILYWFLILSVTAAVLTGCKPGCKDVTCFNGGECEAGGTCKCADRWGGLYCDSLCAQGYEGNNCNIPSRNKFIRAWNATTTSTVTGTRQHTLFVTNGYIIPQIILTNFNDDQFTVVGTITGPNRFEIYSQNATGSYNGVVSGSGYLNGDNLAVNLNKDGVDYFANCNR